MRRKRSTKTDSQQRPVWPCPRVEEVQGKREGPLARQGVAADRGGGIETVKEPRWAGDTLVIDGTKALVTA
jgi:hypothetical protein